MSRVDPRELAMNRGTRTGEAGRRAEKKAAQKLSARQVPGSGSGQHQKGDYEAEGAAYLAGIVGAGFRIEHKSTERASIGLKLEWLLKIAEESQTCGRTPAVALTFNDGNGTPRRGGEWVAIPQWLFQELTA